MFPASSLEPDEILSFVVVRIGKEMVEIKLLPESSSIHNPYKILVERLT